MRGFVLALVLLAASVVNAADPIVMDIQAPIAESERILNTSGNCGWCSLEMLARRCKNERLYGLTKEYTGECTERDIKKVLRRKGVKFEMNPAGHETLSAINKFLVEPCKRDRRGVIVGVDRRHILNVVHYDIETQTVLILDNSDPELAIRQWDWVAFHDLWDGLAIIILPEDN